MPQDRSVLLIRPVLNEEEYSYDQAFFEALTFSLGLPIKRVALDLGYTVIDLAGRLATRDEVMRALELHPNIEIVVFAGHGHHSSDRLIGQDRSPVIDTANISYFRNKGLYFLACHCIHELGRAAIWAGADYVFGFQDKFYLTRGGSAEWIVSHCLLVGLFELLKGASPARARIVMETESAKWTDIIIAERDRTDPDWFLTAAILRKNLESMAWRFASKPFSPKPVEQDKRPPKFFISYSSKDQYVAEQIASSLKSSGFGYWLDQKEILVGQQILDRVSDGIMIESDYLITILSENSMRSGWCKMELRMGYQREIEEDRVFVLPVRIDEVDVPKEIKIKKFFQLDPEDGGAIALLIDEIKCMTEQQDGLNGTSEKVDGGLSC